MLTVIPYNNDQCVCNCVSPVKDAAFVAICDCNGSFSQCWRCSGGVGQTGTFIALDSLLDQGHTEGNVDVIRCVERMRTERMNMVQTQASLSGNNMYLLNAGWGQT